MKNPETDEKLWARITAAFLRAPARPTSLETAAFASKVMARLEQPAPAKASWLSVGLRWLVPATSFALALSFFLILRPGTDYSEPAEAFLLMKGEGSGLARLIAQQDSPTSADLLDLVMGER
jgi:hypothetical protein